MSLFVSANCFLKFVLCVLQVNLHGTNGREGEKVLNITKMLKIIYLLLHCIALFRAGLGVAVPEEGLGRVKTSQVSSWLLSGLPRAWRKQEWPSTPWLLLELDTAGR